MADEIQGSGPTEQPTTHNKRASMVAIALVVIVTVGLVIQTFINYQGRAGRDVESLQETAPVAVERPTTDDFKDAKEQAERQLSYEAARREEEEKRRAALVEMGRAEPPEGDKSAGAAANEDPYQDVYEAFQREEIKRVLLARRSGMRPGGDTLKAKGGALRAASQAGSPPASDSELGRIGREKERAANKLREIEALKERIQEQMSAMQSGGFDPNMAGLRPGAVPSAATASETTGQQVVGEPVDNRTANRERGPRPGEVLLQTGTVLSAVLDMDMMSDYEGPWRGILVRDVYDVGKNYVLLPKGTRFTGQAIRIKNVNEPIQARMAMGVKWAVLPNGNRIDFTKMSALDHTGVAALKDKVNYHIMAQLAGLTAYAVLGAAPSLRLGTDGGDLSSREQALAEMTGGLRNQFGSMAERYLNLVPTITIRAGTPFKIFIEDDLYIKPWERVDDTIYTASY